MALPGRGDVRGVSSGAALAWDVYRKRGRECVTVVGDARRGRFWYAHFRIRNGTVAEDTPYSLVPAAELMGVLRKDFVVTTPHEHVLRDVMIHLEKEGYAVIRDPMSPRAAAVGELVLASLARNQPAAPLKPIYMHPPVLVAPRVAQA